MWEFIADLLFVGLLEDMVTRGPRPVRIGCTVLLLIVVFGLLGLALWAFFFT